MIPFVVLLLVPVLMQHFSLVGGIEKNNKKNTIALTFFFLFLTILVAFRHESVGNDTRNYILFFNQYTQMSWSEILKGALNFGKEALEFGFLLFNKIISLFSQESRFYITVTAIIVSAMIYPTYKRLCIDPSLTIVLFCTMSTFVMMFSGIRQMLAIGLGLIAYEFTRNKKPIPFILSVLLAITLHTSAFMLIFMYPLYHVKITKKWLYFVVPGLLIVFIFNEQFFSTLTYIIEKYTKYEGSITQTGAYTMLLLFTIFAVFAFIIPDEQRIDKETIGLRNFLLFSIVIQMFAPLHMLAMRMNYYYIIFIPLLIPKIIAYRSKRWKQVAVFGRNIMVVFFFAYFFISASGEGNLHVFPYHFFWENV